MVDGGRSGDLGCVDDGVESGVLPGGEPREGQGRSSIPQRLVLDIGRAPIRSQRLIFTSGLGVRLIHCAGEKLKRWRGFKVDGLRKLDLGMEEIRGVGHVEYLTRGFTSGLRRRYIDTGVEKTSVGVERKS